MSVYSDAADILRERGWGPKDPLGACIALALGDAEGVEYTTASSVRAAMRHLGVGGFLDLFRWNDHEDRTFDDVLRLLKELDEEAADA